MKNLNSTVKSSTGVQDLKERAGTALNKRSIMNIISKTKDQLIETKVINKKIIDINNMLKRYSLVSNKMDTIEAIKSATQTNTNIIIRNKLRNVYNYILLRESVKELRNLHNVKCTIEDTTRLLLNGKVQQELLKLNSTLQSKALNDKELNKFDRCPLCNQLLNREHHHTTYTESQHDITADNTIINTTT